MRVLFFAQLKDATGCDSTELTVPSPWSAEQLWVELLRHFPGLASHQSSVRLAKNCEYVASGTTFTNTDEVALIPPVSGG